MPSVNVSVPCSQLFSKLGHYQTIVAGLRALEPRLQRLVAELVMLRLVDELQTAVAGIALRLACGAPYSDGSSPVLLLSPAASTAAALTVMESYKRRPKYRARWGRASDIRDTVKHVLAGTDQYCSAITANALVIAEMQAVRNRIAHRNGNSVAAFANVIRRYYGAQVGISPGALLLSSRFAPPLLERYLVACRVIVKDCARS